MIVLHDTVDAARPPFMNAFLIFLNIVVFCWQLSVGLTAGLFQMFGVTPYDFVHHFGLNQVGTLFSSMFMHGDPMHLIGNMWILFIFGDNIEDRLGKIGYLIFYLACGCIADMMYVIAHANSHSPLVGASGAIAGVLGAYLVLFPTAGVRVLITFWFFPIVPAWSVIAVWFVLNCVYSVDPTGTAQHIAWFAHIGGLVFGACVFFIMPNLVKHKDDSDLEPLPDPLNPKTASKNDIGFKDEIAAAMFVLLLFYAGIFAFRLRAPGLTPAPIQQPTVVQPHKHNVPAHKPHTKTVAKPRGKLKHAPQTAVGTHKKAK